MKYNTNLIVSSLNLAKKIRYNIKRMVTTHPSQVLGETPYPNVLGLNQYLLKSISNYYFKSL